jgi:translation initiation factor IF-3
LSKFYRINQFIKSPELRVIDQDGKQIGVMKTEEALTKAQEAQLDLVEVAASAKPPVAKIIDFTKFKYQETKKEKAGQKSQTETKEVRFSPFMEENDVTTRVNKVNDFLKTGNRVKLVVKFSGREMGHQEFGHQLISGVLNRLAETATVVEAPKQMGRLLIAQVKPKK